MPATSSNWKTRLLTVASALALGFFGNWFTQAFSIMPVVRMWLNPFRVESAPGPSSTPSPEHPHEPPTIRDLPDASRNEDDGGSANVADASTADAETADADAQPEEPPDASSDVETSESGDSATGEPDVADAATGDEAAGRERAARNALRVDSENREPRVPTCGDLPCPAPHLPTPSERPRPFPQ